VLAHVLLVHLYIFQIQGCFDFLIRLIDFILYFFSADVTINVFTYDENSYTEGSYKTVDEIPNIPSEASSTSIMCK